MLGKVSNRFLAVTILAIFIIALVGIATNKSLQKTSQQVNVSEKSTQEVSNQNTEKTYFQIMVVDSKDAKPISDANVVISEIDIPYKTANDGKTPVISLDIEKNNPQLSSQPYKEITIGVFKEGYADYVLFNSKIKLSSQDSPQLKVIRIVKTATPTDVPVFAIEKYPTDMAKEIAKSLKAKVQITDNEIEEITIGE